MDESKQFLYRYRHLDGSHREWTKKIITESILHFSSPADFNDPFDCKIQFLPVIQSGELKRQQSDRIKRCQPWLNRKRRIAQAKQDARTIKADPENFIEFATNGLQEFTNKIGILSLSATDRNILLWSHYAHGHTGLCLKFLASVENPFFASALSVTYATSYPIIKITDPIQKQVDAHLRTKAFDWHYEEEYRIIDHDKGKGDHVFPAELLVGVIFGARMTSEDKREIADWVLMRKSPTELLEASVASESYSLEIRPYKGA
ncbi:MAG: DUF2971 domain-containing protein [Nitrospiraceae bacterium]|nr:DUF2971 domain-containing protein [Nitrospiraceae bacterium]